MDKRTKLKYELFINTLEAPEYFRSKNTYFKKYPELLGTCSCCNATVSIFHCYGLDFNTKSELMKEYIELWFLYEAVCNDCAIELEWLECKDDFVPSLSYDDFAREYQF